MRDRFIRLSRKALGLEVVARECLRRVLGEEELLSWFETDEEIHTFWELDEEERRRLWGEPLDVIAVEEGSREEALPEEMDV